MSSSSSRAGDLAPCIGRLLRLHRAFPFTSLDDTFNYTEKPPFVKKHQDVKYPWNNKQTENPDQMTTSKARHLRG